MSRVNVDGIAFTDPRFVRLAGLLGLADADHARSKVEWLWLACTTRGETDLPQWIVEQHLGPQGPTALVESELARWGRGRGDSKTRRIYICGSTERTTWRSKLTEQSSKGGKARAQNASRVAGRFHQGSAGDITSAPAPAPAPAPALPEEDSAAPAEPSAPFALSGDSPPVKPRGLRHPQLDPTTDHGKAIATFDTAYAKAYGAKPTWGAKPGALISKLLRVHGLAEVQRRIEILFTSPPEWLRPPFDVATLVQHFDKLVTAPGASPTKPKVASIPIAPSSQRSS